MIEVLAFVPLLALQLQAAEVAALVLAAIVLVVLAAVELATRPNRKLHVELEAYRIGRAPVTTAAPGPSRPVTVPWLRRSAEALSTLAERRGWRDGLHLRLQRAGLKVTVGEFLLTALLAGLLLLAAGSLLGGAIGALLALVLAGLVPPALLETLSSRRRRKMETQLTDTLKLIAASLRAGFSLLQGLSSIVDRLPDPMGAELEQALAATRIGVPVEDALGVAAERSGSRDFGWAVTAIRIQREVGGNLAEILDTVADTMKERARLHREVRTLTAEGRISAIILGAMPFGIGGMVYLVNHAYLRVLFTTTSGAIALIGGLLLEIVGSFWLYRTVQIEI